jgi:hypothetical protein
MSGNPWLVMIDLLSELLVNTAFQSHTSSSTSHPDAQSSPTMANFGGYPSTTGGPTTSSQYLFSDILLSQEILNTRPSLALVSSSWQEASLQREKKDLQVYFPDDPKVRYLWSQVKCFLEP